MDEELRGKLRDVQTGKIAGVEALAVLCSAVAPITNECRQAFDDQNLYEAARDSLIMGQRVDSRLLLL